VFPKLESVIPGYLEGDFPPVPPKDDPLPPCKAFPHPTWGGRERHKVEPIQGKPRLVGPLHDGAGAGRVVGSLGSDGLKVIENRVFVAPSPPFGPCGEELGGPDRIDVEAPAVEEEMIPAPVKEDLRPTYIQYQLLPYTDNIPKIEHPGQRGPTTHTAMVESLLPYMDIRAISRPNPGHIRTWGRIRAISRPNPGHIRLDLGPLHLPKPRLDPGDLETTVFLDQSEVGEETGIRSGRED
jgi:hypothetical protein